VNVRVCGGSDVWFLKIHLRMLIGQQCDSSTSGTDHDFLKMV
jgi:hypothetical protein